MITELGRNLFGAMVIELFVILLVILFKDDKRKVAVTLAIGTLIAGVVGFAPPLVQSAIIGPSRDESGRNESLPAARKERRRMKKRELLYLCIALTLVLGAACAPGSPTSESIRREYEIVVASDSGVFVIQAPYGNVISQLSTHPAKSAELMSNGNVLIVDDAIREVTRNGVEVRNLPLPYSETTHALPYNNDTIWISSPNNGGNEPGIISLVDWNGKALVTVENFHWPFQTRRLSNGDILIADGTGGLTELTSSGEVLQTIGLSEWATSIAISDDGSIFYGRPDGYSHISAVGSELSTVREVRIDSIDYLPWGNLIIAARNDNFIKEVTSEGTEVWSLPLDKPQNVRFIE